MLEKGKTYLVELDNWFTAPDGETYKAVFGTYKGVYSSEETLGIKTNARSTNWFAMIGNMTIAGCQIHIVTRTDNYRFLDSKRNWQFVDNKVFEYPAPCKIYNADREYHG